MTISLEPLRTSPTTALTKSYLAEVARQLLNEQDAAIAAAVAAENEQCAIKAHHVISDYFNLADTRRAKLANKVAAAIRARNGAGRE